MMRMSIMAGQVSLAESRLAMLALALTALVSTALAQAQAWHVDCHGQLTVEDLFDGEQPERLQRQWRISVNPEAGYVKRPPELAAGCLEKKVEICGCEQSESAVRCRSMGIASDGTEIAMDFTLDRRSGVLQATGRRHHPASGKMMETTGAFACQAAATP